VVTSVSVNLVRTFVVSATVTFVVLTRTSVVALVVTLVSVNLVGTSVVSTVLARTSVVTFVVLTRASGEALVVVNLTRTSVVKFGATCDLVMMPRADNLSGSMYLTMAVNTILHELGKFVLFFDPLVFNTSEVSLLL